MQCRSWSAERTKKKAVENLHLPNVLREWPQVNFSNTNSAHMKNKERKPFVMCASKKYIHKIFATKTKFRFGFFLAMEEIISFARNANNRTENEVASSQMWANERNVNQKSFYLNFNSTHDDHSDFYTFCSMFVDLISYLIAHLHIHLSSTIKNIDADSHASQTSWLISLFFSFQMTSTATIHAACMRNYIRRIFYMPTIVLPASIW